MVHKQIPMLMRAAIYWAPAQDDPLWQLGCAWLGRDAIDGITVPQPDIPDIRDLTAAAGRYGFHCTLRPPMRLAVPWERFIAAAADIAARTVKFPLPPLAVGNFGGFLALGLTRPSPGLHALADACVIETNPCRAPLTAAEISRRRAAGLTSRQESLLQRWGYPYVMEEWFFHCTLTRSLSPSERAGIAPSIVAHFGAALAASRAVTDICVFRQENDGPFLLTHRFALQ